MPISADRRQSDRCIPSVISFVNFKPGNCKLGRVKNISREGLLSESFVDEDERVNFAGFTTRMLFIDVYTANSGFILQNLPSEVIYDYEVRPETNSNSESCMHKCGLKFNNLLMRSIYLLDEFISQGTPCR